ncbi:MAG TPA: hypothetical protein PK228_12195, partial [Saprospiraceae bacterium]|nr:hypothetical protein [Saprospiraceae bacterium]
DPDIVWAAEIEQDWVVDVPSLEIEWDSGITTLKLLRTEQNESYWSSPFLAELVYHAVASGKLPVFKDPQCQVPLQWNGIYPFTDTVMTFDPETYEEKSQVVQNDPDPFHDFKAWRLRQILSYHQKSFTWNTTVESIAPLVVMKNNNGDSIGVQPLFWFRPDDKRQKLSSSHIVWAKKTKTRQEKTRVPVIPEHPVKITDGVQNPLVHLLKVLENDMKTPFYNTEDDKPLSPVARMSIFSRTDTIVIIDPETYAEKVSAVRNEINLDHIRSLRLMQTWYWDERRQRLSICLDAVAPLLDVYDGLGNFRYSMPLFYRKAPK